MPAEAPARAGASTAACANSLSAVSLMWRSTWHSRPVGISTHQLEARANVADLQLGPVGDDHGLIGGKARPVDEGAVGAAEILDGPLPLIEREPRMVTRDAPLQDHNVVAAHASDRRHVLMQCEHA